MYVLSRGESESLKIPCSRAFNGAKFKDNHSRTNLGLPICSGALIRRSAFNSFRSGVIQIGGQI
jgi:hypothetical protein